LAVRVLEPEQRLEADDICLRHVDQRLKMQLEAVVSQRLADAPFEPQALLKLGVHIGREEANAAATLRLAVIEREIGAAQ
jgi:hypothetical protein